MHSFLSTILLLLFNILATAADKHVGPPAKSEELPRNFHKFVTRPDIDASVFSVDIKDAQAIAPGYWFLAFYNGLAQDEPGPSWLGPHIYDGEGELVWSGAPAFKHWNTFDFGTFSDDRGQRHLSILSHHDSTGYILDSTYSVEKRVPLTKDGEKASNMHAFNVIEGGNKALILNVRPLNVTTKETLQQLGYNGTCNARYEGFRELNLQSSHSRPLFEWYAKDHIMLNESTFMKFDHTVEDMCEKGWDILHTNSVEKFPNGDYLVSARHTDTLYRISHIDGSILWRLGGVSSDCEFLGESKFSRQHHSHVMWNNETHTVITVFDNAVGDEKGEEPTHDKSRGLVLLLDEQRKQASTVVHYDHPRNATNNSRGNFQTLPNWNAFLCWAYSGRISEYTIDGTLVMEAWLDVAAHTYRAFKYPWTGRPTAPPDVVTEAFFDGETVKTLMWVSWNGATDVAMWQVMRIDRLGDVQVMAQAPRTGFETEILYDGFAGDIFVEALDEGGSMLGRSKIVLTSPPIEMGIDAFEAEMVTPHKLPVSRIPPNAQKRPPLDQSKISPIEKIPPPMMEVSTAASPTSGLRLSPVLFWVSLSAVLVFLNRKRPWRRRREAVWQSWPVQDCEAPSANKWKSTHRRHVSMSSAQASLKRFDS